VGEAAWGCGEADPHFLEDTIKKSSSKEVRGEPAVETRARAVGVGEGGALVEQCEAGVPAIGMEWERELGGGGGGGREKGTKRRILLFFCFRVTVSPVLERALE
jgi:hypothetical protein